MAHAISNEGFRRTFVLKPSDTPEFCREYFQDFLQDSEGVGIILIGNGEVHQKASKIIDPFIFLPGAGMPSGRCLWIQDPALLKEEINTAYSDHIPTPLDQCICLFLSKDKTRLVDFIESGANIDDLLIILKFIEANQAKTIS